MARNPINEGISVADLNCISISTNYSMHVHKIRVGHHVIGFPQVIEPNWIYMKRDADRLRKFNKRLLTFCPVCRTIINPVQKKSLFTKQFNCVTTLFFEAVCPRNCRSPLLQWTCKVIESTTRFSITMHLKMCLFTFIELSDPAGEKNIYRGASFINRERELYSLIMTFREGYSK